MKIYLSGAENSTALELLLKNDVKHILMSYYYLRKRKDVGQMLKSLKDKGIDIFLDSGAHTLQHNHKGAINYDKFVEDYIDFISAHKKYLTCWVELDIENVVGYDKVVEWRKKITEAVGEPIVVWHHWRNDYEDVEAHCKNYKYIGLPNKDKKYVDLNRFFKLAKKYKTKVHGFAITGIKLIKRYPFYSVDSTSWIAGARFGVLYHFEHGQMKMQSLKGTHYTKGIYSHKLNQFNLTQWKRFQEYLMEVKV